jgi:hypothetical protein
MDTSTSIYTHAILLYIHTATTIYPESDVGYTAISIRDTTIPHLGAPQSSVFDRLAPPVQDRLRAQGGMYVVNEHRPSKIAGPLGPKGRLIRQGGI